MRCLGTVVEAGGGSGGDVGGKVEEWLMYRIGKESYLWANGAVGLAGTLSHHPHPQQTHILALTGCRCERDKEMNYSGGEEGSGQEGLVDSLVIIQKCCCHEAVGVSSAQNTGWSFILLVSIYFTPVFFGIFIYLPKECLHGDVYAGLCHW